VLPPACDGGDQSASEASGDRLTAMVRRKDVRFAVLGALAATPSAAHSKTFFSRKRTGHAVPQTAGGVPAGKISIGGTRNAGSTQGRAAGDGRRHRRIHAGDGIPEQR